ncbi:MAG: hypothetical protein E6G97_20375 [Alphaproteobacteria bacterium]|nr:MAG: hypothetical protein E6G97_20375 [Alphaproteobacteria bacterium]
MRVLRPANFDRRAKRAGLEEDDIAELIRALIERPQLGPVIPGTGGARKMRIRLPGRGKSGGARVIYAIVLRATALALLDVYTKADKDNLTPAECKTITKLIRSIETDSEQ